MGKMGKKNQSNKMLQIWQSSRKLLMAKLAPIFQSVPPSFENHDQV
jgi:hypothetical protein